MDEISHSLVSIGWCAGEISHSLVPIGWCADEISHSLVSIGWCADEISYSLVSTVSTAFLQGRIKKSKKTRNPCREAVMVNRYWKTSWSSSMVK